MPFAPYAISPDRLEFVVGRYQQYKTTKLSYGTVADFCDSIDQLPELATINRDLKDVQRPWALKALISQVPRGSTLLEIGAGDPYVAHWLSCLGYRVLIVDPYQGYGEGPRELDFYRTNFPEITFIPKEFSDDLDDIAPSSVDCIYSISVLEHIPHSKLPSVVRGIKKYAKSGAPAVHAVDHVVKGPGEAFHLKTLGIIATGFDINLTALDSTLAAACEDSETYFLSAESHNMWRGSMPYESFPMRRCISFQFCCHLDNI